MTRILALYDNPPVDGRVLCVDEFGPLNLQPRLAGTAAGLAGFLQTTLCACATAIVAALTLESALPISYVTAGREMPDDIHPDSRSRLPLIRSKTINPQANLYGRQLAPEGTGPNHIARHAGSLASLEASQGKRITSLAVLVTAREHHSQYDWAMNEPTAVKDGVDSRVIDVVRLRMPLDGIGDKEAALIQLGREVFSSHHVSAATYARALKMFGEQDLVDAVTLMAQHAGDAVLLAAFDQQLPPGQQPRLPPIGGAR